MGDGPQKAEEGEKAARVEMTRFQSLGGYSNENQRRG